MADTLMYIPDHDTHNYTLSKFKLVLKTQLNEPTNQNALQSPKLLSQRIRQRFYKTRTWGLVYLTAHCPLFLCICRHSVNCWNWIEIQTYLIRQKTKMTLSISSEAHKFMNGPYNKRSKNNYITSYFPYSVTAWRTNRLTDNVKRL